VRCVPPENKPVGAEVASCRQFLAGELRVPPAPVIVLSLGGIAHGSVLRALGLSAQIFPFGHGALYHPPSGPILAPSYHCSRYNLNTGRLTEPMFEQVFLRVREALDRL
jgi:uracil-DNA glycosylase